jgi:myo-inositol-1(or 4)-monophosphatase
LARTTEIIIGIAQEAGARALADYGVLEATQKYDGTLVTAADPATERLIRERLRAHFPDHAVFGEELGFAGDETSPYVWYLDPIDGTSNYIFGLPIWGVSIGLTFEGRCIAGAFDMPAVKETYWAWEGGGAFRNGRRLSAATVTEMNHNDLVSVSSIRPRKYSYTFPQKCRCMGSAAHGLAGVAAGHFVGMVHDNWKLHDIAAGLVMCQETGVVATTVEGEPFTSFAGLDPTKPAPMLILAPPGIHARLAESVRER